MLSTGETSCKKKKKQKKVASLVVSLKDRKSGLNPNKDRMQDSRHGSDTRQRCCRTIVIKAWNEELNGFVDDGRFRSGNRSRVLRVQVAAA